VLDVCHGVAAAGGVRLTGRIRPGGDGVLPHDETLRYRRSRTPLLPAGPE
jgi:hypothetical protein